MPEETISYDEEVRPILESRCVVCHGCYDALCQLKLSSPEGIHRGANNKKVYNGARITADDPTRLFVNAMTTEEWRHKGFDTIFNEGDTNPLKNPARLGDVSHAASETAVSTGAQRHVK